MRLETLYTYHWECDDLVNEEVIVQARKIRPSTSQELQSGFNLEGDAIRALDEAQDGLILLAHLPLLRGEVLEDGRGLGDGRQGRDISNAGSIRECAGAGIAQEVVVF